MAALSKPWPEPASHMAAHQETLRFSPRFGANNDEVNGAARMPWKQKNRAGVEVQATH